MWYLFSIYDSGIEGNIWVQNQLQGSTLFATLNSDFFFKKKKEKKNQQQ